MSPGPDLPRKPPGREPTLWVTNILKLGGLGLATYEVVRFGRQADDAVIAFCAICVLGVQVAENALLRLIDRVFERSS